MNAHPTVLVVGFLEALAAERGASANTIEAYRRDLSDYVVAPSRAGDRRADRRARPMCGPICHPRARKD